MEPRAGQGRAGGAGWPLAPWGRVWNETSPWPEPRVGKVRTQRDGDRGRWGWTLGWRRCQGMGDRGAGWKLELPLEGLMLGARLSLSCQPRQGLADVPVPCGLMGRPRAPLAQEQMLFQTK